MERVNYREIMQMRLRELSKDLPPCDDEDLIFMGSGMSTQVAPLYA
jgi:hypothetical protein